MSDTPNLHTILCEAHKRAVSPLTVSTENAEIVSKAWAELKRLQDEIKSLREVNGRLDRRLAMYNDEPGVGGPF